MLPDGGGSCNHGLVSSGFKFRKPLLSTPSLATRLGRRTQPSRAHALADGASMPGADGASTLGPTGRPARRPPHAERGKREEKAWNGIGSGWG